MGDDRVFLNIYELPMSAPDDERLRPYAGITSFFSRILPSTGFGAYHTSLDVGQWTYSYAVGGIAKTPLAHKHRGLPPQAHFVDSIKLGSVSSSANDSSSDVARKVQHCLDHLRAHGFAAGGYHLVCRNCNHFTETLATALVAPDVDLAKRRALKSYPNYVNRLARTGSSALAQSADATEGTTGPCEVMTEARAAQGIDDVTAGTKDDKKIRKQKKELTAAQKQMLVKIKGPPRK